MKITQISVFLENRKGRLAEATRTLGKAGVNIRALTIAETDEFGVLRIVVDTPQKALDALRSGKFVATVTDIVAVEVDDRPGGLASILDSLSDSGLNIEYMYGFLEKKTERAIMVFRFDEPDKALETLSKNGVKVIGQADIQSL
jgi:hypothetical protein